MTPAGGPGTPADGYKTPPADDHHPTRCEYGQRRRCSCGRELHDNERRDK